MSRSQAHPESSIGRMRSQAHPESSIGRMRHVVTLKTFTRAKAAGTGYATDTASDFAASIPAEVTPPLGVGGEVFDAGQMVALNTYLVRIRYRFGVLPKMSIVLHDFGDVELQIEEVSNPDGRRRFLMLKCGLAQ